MRTSISNVRIRATSRDSFDFGARSQYLETFSQSLPDSITASICSLLDFSSSLNNKMRSHSSSCVRCMFACKDCAVCCCVYEYLAETRDAYCERTDLPTSLLRFFFYVPHSYFPIHSVPLRITPAWSARHAPFVSASLYGVRLAIY